MASDQPGGLETCFFPQCPSDARAMQCSEMQASVYEHGKGVDVEEAAQSLYLGKSRADPINDVVAGGGKLPA